MRSILVSDAVWKEIAKHGTFGETEDDALRRIFGLPASEVRVPNRNHSRDSRPAAPGTGRSRRPRFATRRMSSYVRDRILAVEFEGGPAKSFPLGDPSDKKKLRTVRDAAVLFARNAGASYGQEMAVKKALTEAGYHLMK